MAGVQATAETSTGATSATAAVCELAPKAAVTVALWLLGIEAAAVALKAAVAEPAATVTLAGFYLGARIPNADRYILPLILLVFLLSFVPVIVEIARSRRHSTK